MSKGDSDLSNNDRTRSALALALHEDYCHRAQARLELGLELGLGFRVKRGASYSS